MTALRQELRAKEEYLQTAIEELETSNEELKSSNEEMQSINEELQSSNEELETSKEELQSVNEELATVNAELQNKLIDLAQANNDMVLALVLATLVHPLRMRLPRPIRTRRFLAATALTLLTVLFILLPLAGLLALLTSEAVTFIHTTIAWFKTGGLLEALAWVHAFPLPDWAKSYLDPSSIDLRKIESWALSSGGDIGLWFLAAGKGVANIGLQLFVLIMLE